jgi:PAS domain S-box-containing protein
MNSPVTAGLVPDGYESPPVLEGEDFLCEDGVPRLPSSVIVADQRGVIRSVNDATCRLFGYSKNELLGQSINILMPKAIAAQHDAILERYFAKCTFKASTATRTVSGVKKDGTTVKIQLSLSCMMRESTAAKSTALISALIDELVEHSFLLTVSKDGVIVSVSGNCFETCGYSAEKLIGLNVAKLCPVHMARQHPSYMAQYQPGTLSKVIGHLRNRELRHKLGHVIPISLVINEVPESNPLIFTALITEVEKSTEAIITVNDSKRIVSVGPGCPVMFGFEETEMIGMLIADIAAGLSLKEGKRKATCQHKDGSRFFVSVDIQPVMLDGEDCYRGVIRRAPPKKFSRQRSTIQYEDEAISSGDVVGWYEVTDKVLGTGYFGSVKMAIHRLTGVPVAIKTLKKQQFMDSCMPFPPREVELMVKLKHPNIVRFFHSISTENAMYMVTEVVSGGELFDYAAQHERLSERESRVFMRQILSAVDYMHRCGICHRDLKLENILLDACGNIKIIDFGLGNFYSLSKDAMLATFCGSPDYSPPELYEGKPYRGPEVDVWSMGVILFILTTGFIPFNSSTHIMEIRYEWHDGKRYVWPDERAASMELRDLIAGIFRPSGTRCTVEDMIVHPWMNDSGKQQPISRTALSPPTVLNEAILLHVELLGLPVDDARKAVLDEEHNQLFTTYALLEFQLEERSRLRRLSDVSSRSTSPSPTPRKDSDSSSPVSESSSPSSSNASWVGKSSRDSQRNCIIS